MDLTDTVEFVTELTKTLPWLGNVLKSLLVIVIGFLAYSLISKIITSSPILTAVMFLPTS